MTDSNSDSLSALKQPNPNKKVRRINGGDMVYHRDGPMQEVFNEVDLVAPTDLSVLLKGRTGVGKEQLAHDIHNIHEDRKCSRDPKHKKGPFIAIDCGAIPSELIGSELFGHVKGGFTGAAGERIGKFDAANGGTIFLDEIDNMPRAQQVNLLRVLQDKSFYRVGGDTPIKVNVRVIAATDQLYRQVKDGKRIKKVPTIIPALYHRLTEYKILIPELRKRPDDIPILAEHFIELAAMELKFQQTPHLTPDALDALKAHPWKGNVRELGNVIKGATLRAGDGGEITPAMLKLNRTRKPGQKSGPVFSGTADTTQSLGAIILNGRSQSQAALDAKMQRSTINNYRANDTTANLIVDAYEHCGGAEGVNRLVKKILEERGVTL